MFGEKSYLCSRRMTFSWKVGHVLLHHFAMPDNMSQREKIEEDAIGACPGRGEPGQAWCFKRLWMLCISSAWASDVPSQVMTSRWGHEVDFGTCVKRSTKRKAATELRKTGGEKNREGTSAVFSMSTGIQCDV